MTKSEFSSLYKDGGDQAVTLKRPSGVTGLSPLPGKTGELLARNDAARLFGKASLLSICDPNLTDRQHRILDLMAVHFWKHDAVSLSYPEIGWAVNCSERQAMRDVLALESKKYLKIHRGGSSVNQYQPISELFRSQTAAAQGVKPVSACGTCQARGKRLNRLGVCYACADNIRWRDARAELGAQATREAVAQFLHLRQLTRRWERVARRAERAA